MASWRSIFQSRRESKLNVFPSRSLRGFAAASRGAADYLISVGWFPQFNTAHIQLLLTSKTVQHGNGGGSHGLLWYPKTANCRVVQNGPF